jgi:ferritin-like metal-binding protein YciE
MSAIESLQDVYADELKDLWSANDQMTKVVQVMAGKAEAGAREIPHRHQKTYRVPQSAPDPFGRGSQDGVL